MEFLRHFAARSLETVNHLGDLTTAKPAIFQQFTALYACHVVKRFRESCPRGTRVIQQSTHRGRSPGAVGSERCIHFPTVGDSFPTE